VDAEDKIKSTAAENEAMRSTAECTWMSNKRNEDTLKELNRETI
jgi:hypothetical protein